MNTTQQLSVFQGDTFTQALTFMKDDVAIDITGGSIFFTLKANVNDADNAAVIKHTVTTHTNAIAGESQIVLTAAQTQELAPGTYAYDIRYKNEETVMTVVVGTFTVQETVTQTL